MERVSNHRISCEYLNNYIGKNVLIIGKVVQVRNDTAVLDANGHITLNLGRDAQLVGGNAAQVIGKVTPDLSIKVLNGQDLGLDVDYDLAQKVIEVAQQHKSLFAYDS